MSTQNVNLKKHQAILFDLDGTILDTAHDLTMALNKVVQQYNPKKEFTLAEARRAIGYGSETILKELLPEYLPTIDLIEFRDAFRDAYTKEAHNSTTLFEGMAELLAELNTRQIPWGIVTNKTEAGAKQAVNHFKLLEKAQCIVGCDTIGYPKPAPEPLLHACQQIEMLPSQCLFVGDTIIDMEAAHHAKLASLAVDYGYGTQDIINGKFPPFAWIKSPLEVLNYI